jgi:hypothetical protein
MESFEANSVMSVLIAASSLKTREKKDFYSRNYGSNTSGVNKPLSS